MTESSLPHNLSVLRRLRNLDDYGNFQRRTAALAFLPLRDARGLALQRDLRRHRVGTNRAVGQSLIMLRYQRSHFLSLLHHLGRERFSRGCRNIRKSY